MRMLVMAAAAAARCQRWCFRSRKPDACDRLSFDVLARDVRRIAGGGGLKRKKFTAVPRSPDEFLIKT